MNSKSSNGQSLPYFSSITFHFWYCYSDAETYEVKSRYSIKIALENNTSVENIIASNNLTNEFDLCRTNY